MTEFQFLIGSLEAFIRVYRGSSGYEFQFLIGSLEAVRQPSLFRRRA